MAGKNIAVFGIYLDQMSAGEAVDELRRIGFRNTDISILLPDNVGSKDFGHEKYTKAPEGAVAGATFGALIVGALGWLVGTGTLGTHPLWGPFNGVAPIVTLLSGIGVGSMIGGLIGSLIGLTIPEYEAKRYEGRSRNGGILLSVHCDNVDWTQRAKDVLRQTGAKGMAARAEAKADFGASEKPSPRTRIAGILDPANPSHTATVDRRPEGPVDAKKAPDNVAPPDVLEP